MTSKQLDVKTLDSILNNMLDTVNDSKNEIFEIGEVSQTEYEKIKEELENVKKKVAEVIYQYDEMERKVQLSRRHLVEVSRNFNQYSEEEVKRAYEKASNDQMQLSMFRQQETLLRTRRDELERRLLSLHDVIQRAEFLLSKFNVVIHYLTGDLRSLNELLENAREKQEFGLRIIQAQEEERRRISREIHDGPAQMLANVLMRSDLIFRLSDHNRVQEALTELGDLKEMIRASLTEVRRIIYDLRPMALDDLGLVPTLKKYLKNMEEHSNISIPFRVFGLEKRLPSNLEVALFRLTQEAVQNAVKHSKANQITVKIEFHRNLIHLIVQDDGIGFDTEEKKEGSFGLLGMRERIELLNGDIAISSQSKKGTIITMQIPLNEEEQ